MMHSTRVVVVVAAAVLLSGCGGGSSDGGPTPAPPADPGSIATLSGVQAYYAAVVSYLPIQPTDVSSSSAALHSRASMVRRQARASVTPSDISSCDAGGTQDNVFGTKNEPSPFTEQAFQSVRTTYADCVLNFGPPEDPTNLQYLYDGIQEVGSVAEDDHTIIYALLGDTDTGDEVLNQLVDTSGDQVLDTQYFQYGRFDGFYDAGNEFDFRHDVTVRVEHRVDDVLTATGAYRFGTTDEPFRAHAFNGLQSAEFEGEVEVQTETCDAGPVQVHTAQDLSFDPEAFQITGGVLELTSSDGTATVTFNPDGSVDLEDSEGDTQTLPAGALPEVYESDCFDP